MSFKEGMRFIVGVERAGRVGSLGSGENGGNSLSGMERMNICVPDDGDEGEEKRDWGEGDWIRDLPLGVVGVELCDENWLDAASSSSRISIVDLDSSGFAREESTALRCPRLRSFAVSPSLYALKSEKVF